MPKLSVIIAAYNWPEALKLCLQALNQQTEKDFEVIVADDGSGPEVKAVVDKLQQNLSYRLQYFWQEDKGFRAAKARNEGVKLAASDYLVFIDADCLTPKDFVANQLLLKEPGFFVVGNRILLSQNFTQEVINHELDLSAWHYSDFKKAQKAGKVNRSLPAIKLPLGPLRKLQVKKWQGAKTCNLAIWRQDVLAVNGFDEAFRGWGYEDSDLVIRLIRYGVRRKSGKFFAPIIHLWHQEHDRGREQENLKLLEASLAASLIKSRNGIA